MKMWTPSENEEEFNFDDDFKIESKPQEEAHKFKRGYQIERYLFIKNDNYKFNMQIFLHLRTDELKL